MSSARVGREWSVAQRVATHGPVLHRRIRSAVGNSKAVFTLFLFHLPYITRQHHTRTAIAQHCTSARLTLVKHGLALVLSVHFHGLEPRDAVLELGARFINARTRIARDRLAKPVHNVTKCSGQRRSRGARRQKYTFSSGGGGGICCCCCRCFSRDRISTDMQ